MFTYGSPISQLRLRTPLRVTFGNHGTCTKKKNAGNGTCTRIRKITRETVAQLPVTPAHTLKGTPKGHVTLYDVTSGQKALLGRILRNFRLRMRKTYFR